MSSTFVFIFLAAVAFGVPIVFALVFAPLAGFVLAEQFVFLKVLPQRMFAGESTSFHCSRFPSSCSRARS